VTRNRGGFALGTILVVALATRLAAGVWWQSHLPEGVRFGFGDSESYWQLGRAIAQGGPYQYGAVEARVFRTPGYPLLLAAVLKIAGPSVPAARAMSAVLATLAVGGVYWLGSRLFDTPTGLVAALIAALYPGAVVLGGLVLSEAPFCAIMVLQLILWTRAGRAADRYGSTFWLFGAGLAAGAATLVRPSWLLFTPFALSCQLIASGRRRQCLREGAFLLVGLCLAMFPWWARNYRVTGHCVPTTLQVGASLYDGLNPDATGGSNMDLVKTRQATLRQDLAAGGSTPGCLLELRVDRVLRDETICWARAHPGRTLKLAARKFARTWNIWPNEPRLRSWFARAVVMLAYVPLLVLGLLGAWKHCHRGWPYVLCLLPAVYCALLHVVFVGSIRYRQPAMLTLAVLAAAVVVQSQNPNPNHNHKPRPQTLTPNTQHLTPKT
jgi:4-amino-4-deoxy-L-arabinose transferase-like glycosyltransferase